jgi:small-conductance mechanosensitive channel
MNRTFLFLVVFSLILVLFQAVGLLEYVFDWAITVTNLINSIIVIIVGLFLSYLSKRFFKDVTIRKIVNYIIFIGAAVTIFFIFQENLVAIGISLGIIAVAFTLIFQSPILNLVGWIYITMGRVYSEGDRIRVGNYKGDVVDINPMRTKIFEIGGEFTTSDLPSGRVITLPNSLLLSEPVSNFTKDVPYVWVDIPFDLTYETDFEFVKTEIGKIIRKRLEGQIETIKEKYEKAIKMYHIKEEPFIDVSFNLTPAGSWIEFRVTFPVNPKEQHIITTEITEEIIQMFNKYSDKVRFPMGRSR